MSDASRSRRWSCHVLMLLFCAVRLMAQEPSLEELLRARQQAAEQRITTEERERRYVGLMGALEQPSATAAADLQRLLDLHGYGFLDAAQRRSVLERLIAVGGLQQPLITWIHGNRSWGPYENRLVEGLVPAEQWLAWFRVAPQGGAVADLAERIEALGLGAADYQRAVLARQEDLRRRDSVPSTLIGAARPPFVPEFERYLWDCAAGDDDGLAATVLVMLMQHIGPQGAPTPETWGHIDVRLQGRLATRVKQTQALLARDESVLDEVCSGQLEPDPVMLLLAVRSLAQQDWQQGQIFLVDLLDRCERAWGPMLDEDGDCFPDLHQRGFYAETELAALVERATSWSIDPPFASSWRDRLLQRASRGHADIRRHVLTVIQGHLPRLGLDDHHAALLVRSLDEGAQRELWQAMIRTLRRLQPVLGEQTYAMLRSRLRYHHPALRRTWTAGWVPPWILLIMADMPAGIVRGEDVSDAADEALLHQDGHAAAAGHVGVTRLISAGVLAADPRAEAIARILRSSPHESVWMADAGDWPAFTASPHFDHPRVLDPTLACLRACLAMRRPQQGLLAAVEDLQQRLLADERRAHPEREPPVDRWRCEAPPAGAPPETAPHRWYHAAERARQHLLALAASSTAAGMVPADEAAPHPCVGRVLPDVLRRHLRPGAAQTVLTFVRPQQGPSLHGSAVLEELAQLQTAAASAATPLDILVLTLDYGHDRLGKLQHEMQMCGLRPQWGPVQARAAEDATLNDAILDLVGMDAALDSGGWAQAHTLCLLVVDAEGRVRVRRAVRPWRWEQVLRDLPYP